MKQHTKFSHQRKIIFDVLKKSKSHLTAEEIFQRARKIKQDISLATIYRNLHKLEDLQQIIKIQIPNHNPKYEASENHHHHFICTKCGHIEHLKTPAIENCHECISRNNDFKIEKVISNILGVCANCLKKHT